ncbi:MAG: hypothetical protein AAF557_09775 [Pseudomonadota bacterium]
MTLQTSNTPRIPTQDEIDQGIGRGRRLRSEAFREAFAALFALIGSIGTRQGAQRKTRSA